MKRILAIPAALLAAGFLLAAAPAEPPTPTLPHPRLGGGEGREGGKTAPDSQDLVYFGDARPVLIRFHIESDGRPLEDAWTDFIGRLFKHLDADGDGVLSNEEFLRTPAPQALFNNAPLLATPGGGFPGRPTRVSPDGEGPRWTMKRFAAYYRRIGGGPFQSQLGATSGPVAFAPNGKVIALNGLLSPAVSGDAINDAFFNLLDTDKDGKISREELAAAPEILMKLDADEDETVSLNELLGKSTAPVNPLVVRASPMNAPPAPPNLPGLFLMTTVGGDPAELPRQLQSRYGKGAETLTRADLGLDQRTFDRLDADGDGKLDAEELSRFADRPADVELKIRLGKRSPKEAMVEVMKDDKDPSPLAAAVASAPDGSVRIELGNVRLDLRVADVRPPAAPNVRRQQFLAEFKAADRDNNGYLDEQEAMQSRVFSNLFKAMDRDGDGKLFEKEVVAYLDALEDLQSAAATGSASATFADDSRGLFDLVDTNHDGRLSLREMRQMVQLIGALDKDGDGKIGRDEIQKSYQLVFRQGPAAGPGYDFGGRVVVFASNGRPAPAVLPAGPERGPLWFRKMDRNHDGDVSRKEFLGTDEEFRRLDLDGDGLISVEEAEKADLTLRRGKE